MGATCKLITNLKSVFIPWTESMQKESAKSDHPVKRKGPKCAEILGYFDVGPKSKLWPNFGLFSGQGNF